MQQSLQLQGLYQQIVRAAADLSVKNHDAQLRAVLAKQGINVTSSAEPPAGAAAGSASPPDAAAESQKSAKPSPRERSRRGRRHD